nr:hypothetical protein [Tanacetum cinerariifolium]
CEHLPPLGKLPSLKRIELCGMKSLKCFHDEDDAASKDDILFPNLQELVLLNCVALVYLPSNFPKLRRYEREKGEDWPKLSHIPHLFIERPRPEDDDNDENEG